MEIQYGDGHTQPPAGNKLNNRYLYNGKELQDDHDLNWYDYGARFYDAQLARFHSIDPHAENYYPISTYAYVANNPIIRIDPDGRDIWELNSEGRVTKTIKNTEIDQFVIIDNDGNRIEGNTYEYQTVTGGFEVSPLGFSGGGGCTRRKAVGEGTGFSISNADSGAEIFQFIADNVSVEMGLITTQDNSSVVMTNHSENQVAVTATAMSMDKKGMAVSTIVHSHPSNSGPSGFNPGDTRGDRAAAARFSSSQGNLTNHFVYQPGNNALILYDSKKVYTSFPFELIFPKK